MNIAERVIRKKTVTLFTVVCLVLAGIFSYFQLGRLEDPTFTIKTAVVVTQYPGAMPEEVEQSVTNQIEMAAQEMGQVDKVRSLSRQGLSIVYVDIKDKYVASQLPPIWNELRNKVHDAQTKLPPGAKTSVVDDDYGDVYGVYFALTGEGYSYGDLKEYADFLKKEFLLVDDVAKVEIKADQPQVVYVETSPEKMANMGISPSAIFSMLNAENSLSPLAQVNVGNKRVVINPTGGFTSVKEIGELLIGTPAGNQVYLKDVATVKKGYLDPPLSLMRYNGKPAIGIGISTIEGGNVIDMGRGIKNKIEQIKSSSPAGMKLNTVYYQATEVTKSINDFLVNLVEAVAIIVVLLLIFMGISSGLLIGGILLLIILGTFIAMKFMHIDMQSVSMASLIIALGLLVDDAIVITDGILIKIQSGRDRIEAATETVKETMWPLLGATVISILAFAAIGLSQDSTGEYCRSLFQIMAISLIFSWILAISVTPLLCTMILERGRTKKTVTDEGKSKDPYDNRFYNFYRHFLRAVISKRFITIGFMVTLLCLSIFGFTFVKQSFFPDSTISYFEINFQNTEGTSIEETSLNVAKTETFLLKQSSVTAVTSFAGEGAMRFILTYSPTAPDQSYGQLLVQVRDPEDIDSIMRSVQTYMDESFPNSKPRVSKFSKGPSTGAKIEVRYSGPDKSILRKLAQEAQSIMKANPGSRNVRSNWRDMVMVLRPDIMESKARQAGLTRLDINRALQTSYSGATVGIYREGDKLLPVISRIPEFHKYSAGDIDNVQAWSSGANAMVPLDSVLNSVETVFEDPIIHRRNRLRTITAECDPLINMNSSELFKKLKPEIEAIPLPDGYSLEWGGEYESSTKAENGLMRMLPISALLMILIVVFLFNSLKKPAIILLCVPLATIGVVVGLIVTGVSFSFMALLGYLSLAGMLLKDAIVLVSQIDVELENGKEPMDAVIDSAVSRIRPVMMTTLSTVVGVAPLVTDILFAPLAITIMFGLSFATVLTLVVVPVLYVTFYRVK